MVIQYSVTDPMLNTQLRQVQKSVLSPYSLAENILEDDMQPGMLWPFEGGQSSIVAKIPFKRSSQVTDLYLLCSYHGSGLWVLGANESTIYN